MARSDQDLSDAALPPALSGERREIDSPSGRLGYYVAGDGAPLFLLHSVNAAGSAYEVRPLYEHYRSQRRVYAMELPGFGFSDRSARRYTPALMTDAILAIVDEIARDTGAAAPIDALALSLSSEFLARAATRRNAFRTLALVSPTGFDRRAPLDGPPGSHRGSAFLRGAFGNGLWGPGLFRLLTTRRGIRFFLEKTWGSKTIDEGLLDYDYRTTKQPGASNAPFDFISGYLFSKDITKIYESLTMPVWMSHGVRGDFQDYRYEAQFVGKSNWIFRTFQTGALPHFEVPHEFSAAYDAFLSAGSGEGRAGRGAEVESGLGSRPAAGSSKP